MSSRRVLQIGMDPEVIDFSPWPGQSAEALRARLDRALTDLRDAGFEVTTCLLSDDADSAETMVKTALSNEGFDVIEVGAGLRTSNEYTLVFVRVINVVVTHHPTARLCFNDSPETTLDAVRRGFAE